MSVTVSGWCSPGPPGSRPQHERCRMSPSCECSCHLESPAVERESRSQMVESGKQSGPDQRELIEAYDQIPAKESLIA